MREEIFRLGLTPTQRAAHVPGTAIKTNGVGKSTTAHLNLTRSMADMVEFRQSGDNKHVWIDKETGREI
jgi:hypothetical protein